MANTKGTSAINSPQGGGAQSGLGEKFSPDLFTGTGNFSIPIAVPPGRNGFQPDLTLGYSSGNGNGVFGMGWAIGMVGITRKTSKGIPIYEDKSDIFILSGAEDLVPIKIDTEILPGNIGYEKTTYRPRTEGLFARIVRHKKTTGEHYWEVRSKDGLISWYGTPGLTSNDPSVIANPENRNAIYAWHLTKTEDTFGNEILYIYERDLVTPQIAGSSPHVYDQIYLSSILYTKYNLGSVSKYMCEVKFIYEDRPDSFSAYKQGFEVRTTKRCIKIEAYTNAISNIKTKTFHFNYKSNLPFNGVSLLDTISVEGHKGSESEFMPPLEFAYSVFDPVKRELKEITGPLPINSLAEPGFELVDITGDGIPDILQLNGVSRFWSNKGNGKFSPPLNLNIAPSHTAIASPKAEGAGIPGIAFIDSNGDGRTDLLVLNGVTPGYFPGAFQKVWDEKGFRPYTQAPSFNLGDPEVQLMDLDGDGITDVLRNGSKFECFYNDPVKGFYKVRTADKTFADFSFADPRIRFADMTGDGLQDIVLISSGRVQYWPNMGYGRFGKKVNMKNAPIFPEQYDPKQILIGDLDGDGQADIVFIENNRITLYINQSANAFSSPIKIANTPRVSDLNAIRICDIMGTGQDGILWSFGPDAGTPGKMFFLDFTKGNKPYVLEQMNNNMGSLTRVSYGSSVYHYLRDQVNLITRWKTQLPFPVQVVNRVEVYDFLSEGKLVTEYNYHNGYWDGIEREFRGFAHVDSVDTETFERFNTQDLFNTETVTTVTIEQYSPPTQTKSWFYVGPVGDGFSKWKEPNFSDEYWTGDAPIFERPLQMTNLLNSLPRRAGRDALRTLRGTLLRSELYALDGSVLQSKPYTVTENLMSFRMEFNPSLLPDPLWNDKSSYWSGGGYVFFPFNIAQRTTQYERGIDPMHNISFTKDYDVYGQVQGQLSIGVPRHASPISGGQGDYLSTYSISEFIYKDFGAGQYIINRTKRTISYDSSQNAIGKSVFALRDAVFNSVLGLPVINCTLCFYDGPAFTGLPYGQMGNFGAQIRCETLVITDAIISAAYGANIPQCFVATPNWSAGYPAAFVGQLQNNDTRLGYKDRRVGFPDHIAGWYAESSRAKYDFQIGPGVGLLLESLDVFNNLNTINYDVYNVFPLSNKQWLNGTDYLETKADYDYRVMQPFKVTDVNENISEFDFSPLGLLTATALIGKGTEGDYKSNSGGFYDRFSPSLIIEYNFSEFKNSGNPVWVKTIKREKHYQQSVTSPTIEKVEYNDGFGRILQIREQAEDIIFGNQNFGSSGLPANQNTVNANAIAVERLVTDPLNVVVSGLKIYNNKGKVIEQYEPFFDKGFGYFPPEMKGVKAKAFYDCLGRVLKIINPDNSEQWTLYGIPSLINIPSDPITINNTGFIPTPWINFAYDPNDLASITNIIGNNVPVTHYFTPKSSEIDSLGRVIKTIEYYDNGGGTFVYNNTIQMDYKYDIRDNLLLVKDSYNRIAFEQVFDLRMYKEDKDKKKQALSPLLTNHIDKGQSTILFDSSDKIIESKDGKGATGLTGYDKLQRSNYSWACNIIGDAITLRNHTKYGDSAGLINPQNNNLKSKVYKSYDEAGLIETPSYDFKGNILIKNRQVINSATIKAYLNVYTTFIVDWTGLPSILDSFIYASDMQYDALNRIIKLTLPKDVTSFRKEIVPTYNNSGALQSVSCDGSIYVENIAYNAKGQRLMIAFGNNIMTRYEYDCLTFRLLRQRSEKFVKTTVGNVITYAYSGGTNKQDDGFNLDLVGNIVKILTRVTDCGISSTILGSDALDRTFSYDSIYRLITANGREANTQSGNSYLYDDAPDPGAPNANNVRAYARSYNYDKMGNILKVIQSGTNGFTRAFTYNAGKNSLQKIEDATPSLIQSFSYDNCGNQIKAGVNRNYKWNQSDQLICYYNQSGTSDPTVFTQYDYCGWTRVSKLVRTGSSSSPIYERTIYIDGIFEHVILENGTVYKKNYINIMDDKSRIAEIRIGDVFPGDISDNQVYILEDQIGSSVVRLDINGTIIDKEEYYPFGDSSLRTFIYKRYRYVGKERDQESGLYYYGTRYYSAWTCRFISVDPLFINYAFITPYNYAENKPINKIDLDGLQSIAPGRTGAFPPPGTPHIRTTHVQVNGTWYRQQAGVDVTPGVLNRVNNNNALNGGLGEKVSPTQASVTWYPIKGPAPTLITTTTTVTNTTTQFSGTAQMNGLVPPMVSTRIITVPNSGTVTAASVQVMTGNFEGNTITITNLTTGATLYNSSTATLPPGSPPGSFNTWITPAVTTNLTGISPGDQLQITQTHDAVAPGLPITPLDQWTYSLNITNTTSVTGPPVVTTPPAGSVPVSSPGLPVTPAVNNVNNVVVVNTSNVTATTSGQ